MQIKEDFLRENRLAPSLVENLSIYESRNLDKVAIIDILIPLDIDIKMSFAGEKHFQNMRFLLVNTVAILLLYHTKNVSIGFWLMKSSKIIAKD